MKLSAVFSVFLFSVLVYGQNQTNANSSSVTASAGNATNANVTNTSEVKIPGGAANASSPFGIHLYTLGGYDDSQLRNPDPSFSIYDAYVSLSWKLSNDVRVSLLPTFGYTTAGNDFLGKETTDKFYWRDFSISIGQSNILESFLPATVDLKQKARVYLPTSDGSKEEGMIARLRIELEGRSNLDQFSSVRYYMKPSYYFQRTTAFLNGSGKTKTTKLADIQYGSEFNWNLNKYLSLKPGFEIEDDWTNKSDVNDREASHISKIGYRAGLEVRPNRDINFTIGIQDSRDLINPSVTPTVSYSLLTNVTLY